MRLVFVISVLIMLSLISCDRIETYSEWKVLNGAEWYYQDSLEFNLVIPDTSDSYDMYINLEYNDTYRFRNSYFYLTTATPGGKISRELINVRIQENSGEWMGNCSGSICRSTILLKPGKRFKEAGEYSFYLQQNMRKNPLREIRSAGLRLERG